MLTFDRQGLIPVVIQDATTDEVLMVAFMNEEAFRLTRETGYTHFFSRSRNTIWRKGEQSGHIQEVKAVFINCEESSLLIRVVQHGEAACHEGYRSCYYRRLQPDDSYQTVAKRIFDPATVYGDQHHHVVSNSRPVGAASSSPRAASDNESLNGAHTTSPAPDDLSQQLATSLRQLYGIYMYLRDHDLSEESNTSRLLHEPNHSYLVSRLADELQELSGVQSGEHVHSGLQSDTILEGSQVGYWLFLIATGRHIAYDAFSPHSALLEGYNGYYSEARVIEQRQNCLNLLVSEQPADIAEGLQLGFSLIGWACAGAGISPLEPAAFDLEQMRRKGLIQ